jgi:hypothetical protein
MIQRSARNAWTIAMAMKMIINPTATRFAVMFAMVEMILRLPHLAMQALTLKSAKVASKNAMATRTTMIIMKQVAKKLVGRDAETMSSACRIVWRMSVFMMISPNVMRFAVMFVMVGMVLPLRLHETQEVTPKTAKDARMNVMAARTTMMIMNDHVKKLVARDAMEI